MDKIKLSDLEEESIVTRHQRNEFGELEKVERIVHFKFTIPNLTAGLRLINCFIDILIVSQVISRLLFLIPYGEWSILINITYYLSLPLYYILMEYFFQRTIGKMLTGSIVINEYADSPSLTEIGLRTIIRFIPFEALSFLNNSRGWHDRWTNTCVIKASERPRLKELLSK